MTTLTEGLHAAEFIASEANGSRSREAIVVATGENLGAGSVVAQLTANGFYVAYDNAGSDGSEVAAGVLFDAVDASTADAEGVAVVRDAEIIAEVLDWNGVDQTGIDAGLVDLEALGIVAR